MFALTGSKPFLKYDLNIYMDLNNTVKNVFKQYISNKLSMKILGFFQASSSLEMYGCNGTWFKLT